MLPGWHARCTMLWVMTRDGVLTRWWQVTWVAVAPDDRAFLALWATWVVFVALVGYVLLGWTGGALVLGIAGAFMVVTTTLHYRVAYRPREAVITARPTVRASRH